MEELLIQEKHKNSEARYLKISLFMVGISLALLGISAIMVQSVIATPMAVISATTMYLYAHLLHFVYGWIRIFSILFSKHKRAQGLRIGKSVLSIFISPISALITYVALILFVLSSCAS